MKVFIEQLEFPSFIKDKILKLKDVTKINTEFISGKYIHFENTNLSIHEPHEIIFSNDSNYFVLINYENDSTLYDKETMKSVTIEMIKFVILKLAKNNIFEFLFFPLFIMVCGIIFCFMFVYCLPKMWYYGNTRKLYICFIVLSYTRETLLCFLSFEERRKRKDERKNCVTLLSLKA